MITLHLLQLLADNDLGTINETLHWEKLPQDKTGIAIISRGAPREFRGKWRQDFELWSRGTDDIMGNYNLEKVCLFLDSQPFICSLPSVPGKSNIKYQQTHIEPLSGIESLGENETGRIEWRATYTIYYERN